MPNADTNTTTTTTGAADAATSATGADGTTKEAKEENPPSSEVAMAVVKTEPTIEGVGSDEASADMKKGTGGNKLLKELDDEAPKTFPQVVSYPQNMKEIVVTLSMHEKVVAKLSSTLYHAMSKDLSFVSVACLLGAL